MSEYKKIALTGKGYWFNLRTPNELSGDYQLDLSIDDDTANKLRIIGISIKNKEGDSRGNYVTLKSKTHNKDGSERGPIKVIDTNEQPLAEDVLIGHGSIVKVIAQPYDWKHKPTGKSGTSLGLGLVQVLDFVEYVPKDINLLRD